MEDLSIREILEQVTRGQIRIPAFQRGYVWEPDRAAYLMDSIHKGYPFGSLLFWRTKAVLKFDRKLGPIKLPEPKVDYPVDYVLDGQQRITSIFCAFQTEFQIEPGDIDWLPLYFDLAAKPGAQDSQFVALSPADAVAGQHFPLNTLFDTTAYRAATAALKDEAIKRVDEMQSVFKETKIPVQISKTDDKATVAIIFERVNRQGVELDTLQLLSAWTWSEDFQLLEQFSDLADELGPFGFAGVGGDQELLLRCCSAVLAGDASPEALMSLNGQQVREQFESVTNGVKYAVDYIRRNFHVQTLGNLPFSTLLVPLSVFFAVPGNQERNVSDDQRQQINRWFWRVAFSRRYSSGVLRYLKTDIDEMKKLKAGQPSQLGDIALGIDEEFFTGNQFNLGNVNTKTFVLLLASLAPRSFSSGAPIDLQQTLKAANRAEFHHLMPRAYLKEVGVSDGTENSLANICILSRADNRALGGVPPSQYRAKLGADENGILATAACPVSLFADDFPTFLDERAKLLAALACEKCGI